MESLKSGFSDAGDSSAWFDDEPLDLDGYESDTNESIQAPPPAIGQDERRMQVRAYNLWANLLGDRAFPDIKKLKSQVSEAFGENSVVLDFSAGIDDPMVVHLGAKLATECGLRGPNFVGQVSDIPPGSLLARLTDHYVQILARQAPIGFEAEFVNRRGKLIVYRGILLPFSSDDVNIDHIYGVLNWKEVADAGLGTQIAGELASTAQEAEAGPAEPDLPAPLARRLRAMTPTGFDALAEDGPEFALLMARRLTSGNVVLLGEVPHDAALMKRAADRLEDR